METFRQLLFRLRAFFRRERLDADMTEEMRHHLELRTERNVAAGMSVRQARLAAAKHFGGIEQLKEQARDLRRLGRIEEWLRDVRFAARSLRRAPGFTAVAIGSMALGLALIATTLAVV